MENDDGVAVRIAGFRGAQLMTDDGYYTKLLRGGLSGMSQVVIGHPFDTAKVWAQRGDPCVGRLRSLYRGVGGPLVTTTPIIALQFGAFEWARGGGYSPAIAGALSGIPTALVSAPVEYVKIMQQAKQPIRYRALWSRRSLLATAAREVPASYVYFGAFHHARERWHYSTFVSGSLAGVLSWGLTYPMDVVKTLVQSNARGMPPARALWVGYATCLARAGVVNGVGFCVYGD